MLNTPDTDAVIEPARRARPAPTDEITRIAQRSNLERALEHLRNAERLFRVPSPVLSLRAGALAQETELRLEALESKR